MVKDGKAVLWLKVDPNMILGVHGDSTYLGHTKEVRVKEDRIF